MTATTPPLQVKKLPVWQWTKATVDDALTLEIVDATCTGADRQTPRLPPEILEMIISHFKHDTRSLKACATTCFAWYLVAAPHLHHTLSLQWGASIPSKDPNPLKALHELGLLPLVKKVQLWRDISTRLRRVPEIFDSENLGHFSALVSLQDLSIRSLDFDKFGLGFERHLCHLSSTLRSIALIFPSGPPQKLLDFLRLFPKLDDIKITRYQGTVGAQHAYNSPRDQTVQGSLRGKLTLKSLVDQHIMATFGGMRFTSIQLGDMAGAQPLLDACAETLEVFRFHLDRPFYPSPLVPTHDVSLSRNTVLRSLEVQASSAIRPILEGLLSTIASPVFSEIVVVFSADDVCWPPCGLAEMLHEMYEIRKFRVVFCLEAEEIRASILRALESTTQADVANGSYDFLPGPPVIFSRNLTKYTPGAISPPTTKANRKLMKLR